jgi:hypothetical protein
MQYAYFAALAVALLASGCVSTSTTTTQGGFSGLSNPSLNAPSVVEGDGLQTNADTGQCHDQNHEIDDDYAQAIISGQTCSLAVDS